MTTIKSIKKFAKEIRISIKNTKAVYSKKFPDTATDTHWRKIMIETLGAYLKEMNELIKEIEKLEGN